MSKENKKIDVSDCGKFLVFRVPKLLKNFYGLDKADTLCAVAKAGMGVGNYKFHWMNCKASYCGERVTTEFGMSNGDGWELLADGLSLSPSIGGEYHYYIKKGRIEFLSDSKKYKNEVYELEDL